MIDTPLTPIKEKLDVTPPPNKWSVMISHDGKYCPSLVEGVMKNVFHEELFVLTQLLYYLSVSGAEKPVKHGLPKDIADTLAYRANEYCKDEQDGCECGSSLTFFTKAEAQ